MRDIYVAGRPDLLESVVCTLAARPGATMSELARGAGVSRATLHRRFASRDALLRAVAGNALDVIEAALASAGLPAGSPVDTLEAAIGALVPLGARFHFLLAEPWLEEDPLIAARLERVQAGIVAVMERARRQGRLRADLPVEFQAAVFFELVYVGWANVASQVLVPRDAVTAVIEAFLRGQAVPR